MKKVREGYKITEFGEIPSEWEVKKLKDLGNSVIGLTYSPDDLVDGCNGTLVLRSSNIRNNRIVFDDNKYVNKDIQEKLIVKENDILICSRNGSKELIGKCALIDKKAEGSSFGAFMTVYRSKYNKYLFNVFTSYMFKRQIYNNLGATINQITTDNLNNFKIIVPTIKEQEKIASILSTVDEQIDNVDALIEKNKELKKGLMQTLLTKGIGHTKFKKTEIGEIPEEWEVRILGDIVEFSQGIQVSLEEQYEEYKYGYERFLRIIDYTQKSKEYRYIKHPGERYLVKNNDVVMVRYGATAGFVGTGLEGAIANNIFKITPNREVLLKEFLYVYLNQDNIFKSLNMATGASAMPAINFGIVSKLNIILPSIYEQKKITSILFEVDKKLEEYENKKQKLEELKKGLMQQLLTGMIRVTV